MSKKKRMGKGSYTSKGERRTTKTRTSKGMKRLLNQLAAAKSGKRTSCEYCNKKLGKNESKS